MVPISLSPCTLPACQSFLITEFGYAYRANSFARNTFNLQRRHYFSSDLGLMRNLSSRYAAGLSQFTGLDNGGESRGGVKFVFRRWINGHSSINLAPGFLLWDTRASTKGLPFIASLDLNLRDLFILWSQLEVVRTRSPGGTDRALYLGLKTGSSGGLLLNSAAGLAAVVVAILAFSSGLD